MQRASEMQMAAVLQRLERLERANRRWQIVVSVFVLLSVGVVLMGAEHAKAPPVAEELRARTFLLVDAQGMPLARLGYLPHGGVGLGLYDKGRQSRVLLSMDDDGASSLSLYGKEGRGGALVAVNESGATSLRLLDTNWKNRLVLATWPNGAPFLQMADREGKDRILLGYTDLRITATGSLVERSSPALLLFNPDETVLWRAP